MANIFSDKRTKRVASLALSLAFIVATAYVVSTQFSELKSALSQIEAANIAIIAIAALSEIGSVASFGLFNYVILRGGSTISPLTSIETATANTTINNSIPGGTAFASIYSFRQYRRYGATPLFASWAVITINVLSGASLAILAAAGVALSFKTSQGLDLILVVPGTVVALLLVSYLLANPRFLVAMARPTLKLSYRLIKYPKGGAIAIQEICNAFADHHPKLKDLLAATAIATFNWIFDALVLVLAYEAIGKPIPWSGLLLAYGAGQLAANLPVTPGGLGVVEGSLSIALVAYGGAQSSAVAAVLIYRLISYWMTMPLGFISYFITTGTFKVRRIPTQQFEGSALHHES
ncbi:MAG: YbhN family protein [Actinomycetota bacterium]|nr:YbhN family protein [Actinomycetota bacterium]